jgi:hypothetical protein
MVIPNLDRTAEESARLSARQQPSRPTESGPARRAPFWVLGVPIPVRLVAYLRLHH